MTYTEAHKEANTSWDRKNMRTLSCSVRKETADAFQQYAKERKTSTHGLLKDYVSGCLAPQEPGYRPAYVSVNIRAETLERLKTQADASGVSAGILADAILCEFFAREAGDRG